MTGSDAEMTRGIARRLFSAALKCVIAGPDPAISLRPAGTCIDPPEALGYRWRDHPGSLMPSSIRRSLAVLLLLAACGNPELEPRPEPIGDFRPGHLVVVADAPQQGPFSRDASREELETALRTELEQRLRRYDGDGLYHIGVKVEGYVLAQPGIPVVYQPKSVLLLGVSVIDNATRQRLNPEAERIYAFEGLRNTVPVLGSGLTRSKEEQLENLAFSAAKEVEAYLRRNPQWFEPKPGQVRVPFTPVSQPPTPASASAAGVTSAAPAIQGTPSPAPVN